MSSEAGSTSAKVPIEDNSPTARGSSWLSLRDRADLEIGQFGPRNVRLSERVGQKLREELLVGESREGQRGMKWEHAISAWRNWYDDQRDMKTVVANEDGETVGFRTPNRFTPEYRERRYAQLQSLEKGLRDEWGKVMHTAMLSLTNSTLRDGGYKPPADHLEELLSSWESVRRELHRVLEDREWEYCMILEPHPGDGPAQGYAHAHIGVFVRGPVAAEQFQSVLDAHVRNCEGAEEAAHQVYDEDAEEYDAVSVKRVGDRHRDADAISNLGAYLSSYIGGDYDTEATDQDLHVQAFYATIWGSGRQSFRPSNGAQEHMQPDDDDDDDDEEDEDWSENWRLVGIAPDGDLDDVIEITPGQSRSRVYGIVGQQARPPPRSG